MTKSYLSLIRKVLQCSSTPNRTGINARSCFGYQLKFNLRNNTLPIITTRPMPIRVIANELFWFMRGQTNQRILENQNVMIWKANSSRKYLDSRGLYNYKEYESLGPIYGFQWRNFGAKYVDCYTNYSEKGIDQLKQVVNAIKYDPTSRRIIMTAWNPLDLHEMALPPCHILIQFHVDVSNKELSAHLYQRSADLMLGVPFNITSYSLLVHILAKICGLSGGELIHSFGDVHIYENHIYGAKQQLLREPKSFPKVDLNINTTLTFEEIIDNLEYNQVNLINYEFDNRQIKFVMAV